MKLRWLLLFVFGAFPLASSAEIFAENSGITGNWYLGVQVSGLDYEEPGLDFQEPATALRFGFELFDHFAFEGHFGAGLHDDTIGGTAYGVDYYTGLYLRGNIFLWDPRARLYALAGISRAKISRTAFGLTTSTTYTDPSYGVGLEFYGNPRNAINLEFMRYIDGDDGGVNYDINTLSLGYIHRF
jgi:hypothetical protein